MVPKNTNCQYDNILCYIGRHFYCWCLHPDIAKNKKAVGMWVEKFGKCPLKKNKPPREK